MNMNKEEILSKAQKEGDEIITYTLLDGNWTAESTDEEAFLADVGDMEDYAEYFTRPLIKEFKHPLFVSYAYNGGPGFTRRLLAKNQLFKKSNPLDPWYSMEMIPYEETRKYGKKVLANYIIYQKSFGKDIKLLNSLQQTLLY